MRSKANISRRRSRPDDLATAYARAVERGEIAAGPLIRAACRRHLEDLEAVQRGRQPWLAWEPATATHVLEFCREVCTVVHPVTRRREPFAPLWWQAFVLGSLFGWRVGADDPLGRYPGSRRFRTAYIESGKGSGKSPLAAAVLLYGLLADGEREAEIYIAAANSDQALIPWRDLKEIIQHNPELDGRRGGLCEVFGGTDDGRVVCAQTASFIQTLAHHSEGAGRSGYRPHMVLVEEFHEHPTRSMLDILDEGKKGRSQPLTLIVTNAGTQQSGPCWEEHAHAAKVVQGQLDADDYFAAIFSLDRDDDPFASSDCWVKANPSLGTVIRNDYLTEQRNKAKISPARRAGFLRLNMARWPDGGGDWMDWETWQNSEVEALDEAALESAPLYVGLDLADVRDMTALACAWKLPDGKLLARVRFFTAADTLIDRDDYSSGHLSYWAEKGLIETTPGRILNYRLPARVLGELAGRYDIQGVAYDRYHVTRFEQALEDEEIEFYTGQPGSSQGLHLVDHPQGFLRSKRDSSALWMPASIQALENRLLATKPTIAVEAQPVLRWNLAAAAVKRNESNAIRFDKRLARSRSQGSIDGLVALAMAVGLADHTAPEPTGLAAHWSNPDTIRAWLG